MLKYIPFGSDAITSHSGEQLWWLTTVFFNNSGRDACAKQATQDLSRIQHSRQGEKETPRSSNMNTFRIKFPIILGFLKKVIL